MARPTRVLLDGTPLLGSRTGIGRYTAALAEELASLSDVDMRAVAFTLRGWRKLLDGWVSFCLVCSVGAIADVGVAIFLFNPHTAAWVAPALAGIAVGAVWNYALSSRFVWGRY